MLSITGISGWMTACFPPTPRTVRWPTPNSSPTCTARHGSPSCCGGLRIGVQGGLRVGVQQRRQPLGVGVVGMLVGDQDRRQPGDALEAVGERAGSNSTVVSAADSPDPAESWREGRNGRNASIACLYCGARAGHERGGSRCEFCWRWCWPAAGWPSRRARLVAAPRWTARRSATGSRSRPGSPRPRSRCTTPTAGPNWPPVATPATAPLFRFEEACASPAGRRRPRLRRGGPRRRDSPDGQWHLQAQVMHWRGEAWRAGEPPSGLTTRSAGRAARLPTDRPADLAVAHHRRTASAWPP